jgi:cytochrome c oxidase subunit 3
MILFLLSLSVLFAASLAGYLVVWIRAPEWPPAGSPPLPAGLWLATLVLLLASGAMHLAKSSIRAGRETAARRALVLAFALGLLFLAIQIRNWNALGPLERSATSALFGFTFYMLTGLHAAHVLGGLIALAIVAARARRGAYSASEHGGIESCAMYWHFLDAAWIVLFAVLLIGSA